MQLRDEPGEDGQRPEPDWIYFTDPNRSLGKFCLGVVSIAIAALILIDILNS